MESETHTQRIIIKKFLRAVLFFVVIAMAIPLTLGYLTGTPLGSIVALITSTFVLQAGAPLLGVALGLSNSAILVTMVCFALGMVLAVFEICDSLSSTSPRVQRWLEKMEKAGAKYPQLQKYGVISCFFIAWIPPFGIYGAPVFAWIMSWKRLHSILIIVSSFTTASVFVLFFSAYIPQILFLAANLGAVIFIITSMITLGLSNTVPGVLTALKDKNFVIRLLLANFILVPCLAYLLVAVFHLPLGLATGLILVGSAAGSPFLPRVLQIPADRRALAGGVSVLLTILSVLFIPVIVPFMVPGEASFDPLLVLMAFVILILVPLGLALHLRPGREDRVARMLPWLDRTSYGGFFAAFIGVMYVFFDQATAAIGYGGFIAIIIFILAAFGIGHLLGGNDMGMQRVLSFGTAQRGLAVAMVLPVLDLVAQYFIPGYPAYDATILITIVTLGIAGLIILMLLAKKLPKQGSPG